MSLLLALLAAAAALLAARFGTPALLEAWLLAWLSWGGLALGALGALAIGHLLREDWLDPVRAPLEAAARSLPLLAILALPVLAGPEALYPWAAADPPPMPAPRAAWYEPFAFQLRVTVFLVVWTLLALLLTWRAHPGRRVAALVLAGVIPTATMAAQDLALSRDPSWWGSLQGFSVWVEGMMAALALAALVSLARREMPAGAAGAGEALERALLALGLTTIWLWFTQFIVVWMADLPEEAGWYLRRMEEPWGFVKLGIAVPALVLALALAAPPRHRPWRMGVVCALLLASHLAHLWWVVRPDAPAGAPPLWLDAAVLAALGLLWIGWWRARPGARVTRPPQAPSPARDGVPAPARASAR